MSEPSRRCGRTARPIRPSSGSTSETAQSGSTRRAGVQRRVTSERDPRVSLLVVDPNDAYKWVAVSGRAELTDEGADEQIDKLAKKYIGRERYPWRNPREQRVAVWISPDTVDASGFAGRGG